MKELLAIPALGLPFVTGKDFLVGGEDSTALKEAVFGEETLEYSVGDLVEFISSLIG